MHEYTCPECSTVMRASNPVPAGKKIRCKECGHVFAPVGTFGLKEEEPAKRPEPAVTAYAVAAEDANTIREHVVKFGEVEDKFKRSARGPAMAMMVLPSNLLIAQGALFFLCGLGLIIYGMFPLIFTEVEPSEDDYRESAGYIVVGFLVFVWGCLICFGASRMQNLESYTWAWVGAVAGIPAGIYAAVLLRNPKVVAGFQEMEGALEDDEDEEGGSEDDENGEDEDDDE